MTGDELLKRRIEKALAVEPPPEFVARVRARVERRPESTRASGAYPQWLSIAALLFIIVALEVLGARERASIRARLEDTVQRERLVRELADRFGGDQFAVRTARALIESPSPTRGAE